MPNEQVTPAHRMAVGVPGQCALFNRPEYARDHPRIVEAADGSKLHQAPDERLRISVLATRDRLGTKSSLASSAPDDCED